MPVHSARLAEGHEEALKRELKAYQDNELALQKALTAARVQLDEMAGKSVRFDAVQKRLAEVQEAYQEAKHRADATVCAVGVWRRGCVGVGVWCGAIPAWVWPGGVW